MVSYLNTKLHIRHDVSSSGFQAGGRGLARCFGWGGLSLNGLCLALALVLPGRLLEARTVSTPDPVLPVLPGMKVSSQDEPGVRLVAPRNGAATAPILLPGGGDSQRLPRIQNLQHKSLGATLPADAVRFRYGLEGLYEEPQRGEDPGVVWVTVEVPPSTMPGTYTGTIMGLPQPVPVRVDVGEWLAPRPSDYRFVKGFIQSPETPGLYYETRMWSDKHFEVLEASLRLLGQLGNDTLYVSGVGRTHLTDDYPLLRWIRRGDQYTCDFSVLERYLKLWDHHVGPPRYVILNVLGGSDDFTKPTYLSVVNSSDSTGGDLEEGPALSDPESEPMWRAAVEGIEQRMADLGWEDTQLLWGTLHDGRDWGKDFSAFFKKVGPSVKWEVFTHGRGEPVPRKNDTYEFRGLRFQHVTKPYDAKPNSKAFEGEGDWNRQVSYGTSHRHYFSALDDGSVALYRHLGSLAFMDGKRKYDGFSRVGFDYWRVSLGRDTRPIIGTHDRQHRLYRNNPRSFVRPGPEGAVSTHAFEMAREGLAEAEAYAMIHDAISAGKVPGSLRAKAMEVGQKYVDLVRKEAGEKGPTVLDKQSWQDVALELFNMAAQVAEVSGQVAKLEDANVVRNLYRESRAREWTSEDGRTLTAQFLDYDGRNLQLLLPNNRTVSVPPERLSPEDVAWMREETGIRKWRNQDGEEIEARLLDADGERVRIEMANGKTFLIPLAMLSKEDQEYVQKVDEP